MKRQRPRDEIVVVEQNARDATFGFGVVFSRGALEFLSRDEPALHATLAAALESWPLQRIVHKGERVDIDGNGFSAIARIALLQILQRQCEALGVRIEFERALDSRAPLASFDLVVGADGVDSMVRRELQHLFQPRVEWLTNKFVWYGTAQRFECLTLTFRTSGDGAFVAHHYRYAPALSTFIVECDAATWHRAGLQRASEAEGRAYCERLFAPDLGGHALVSNKSVWRNFPLVWNTRWSAGNTVLIGDALRTGTSRSARARASPSTTRSSWRARSTARAMTYPGRWRRSRAPGGRSSRSSSPPPPRARTGTSVCPTRCGWTLGDRLRLYAAKRPHDRRASARGSAGVHAPGR
jgi:2-polyprenyl-6-methoxyphenol hydroxylase-like FAD-dependent oxidoreductase